MSPSTHHTQLTTVNISTMPIPNTSSSITSKFSCLHDTNCSYVFADAEPDTDFQVASEDFAKAEHGQIFIRLEELYIKSYTPFQSMAVAWVQVTPSSEVSAEVAA
jgi:hypothetical protein